MESTIYLVRHAEACPGTDVPNLQWPLSDRGVAQARAMRPMLSRLCASRVYCSPARRCCDTLRPYIESSRLPFFVHEGLRERQLGANWLPNYRAILQASWADFSFAPEGGESSYACRQRMEDTIGDIRHRHAEESVIIGTHGHAIGLFMTTVVPQFTMEDAFRFRTPEVVKLNHDGFRFK